MLIEDTMLVGERSMGPKLLNLRAQVVRVLLQSLRTMRKKQEFT